MTKVKVFESRSNFKSRSLGQKLWYDVKGLITRNRHVKYESSITFVLVVHKL